MAIRGRETGKRPDDDLKISRGCVAGGGSGNVRRSEITRTPSPISWPRAKGSPGMPGGHRFAHRRGRGWGCRCRVEGWAAGLPSLQSWTAALGPRPGSHGAPGRADRAAPAAPGACRACHKTSVLLAERFFARRQDSADVIGQALLAKAAGAGQRVVAARLGRTRETVRNWFRSFGARAALICRHFLTWALALDARLHEVVAHGSAFADAVEAVALAARAASLAFRPRPVWSWASRMSRGGLLSNTTWPYPAPP